ncbi:unnamed protein product [marine sediment metagenome]|uniref:PKMT C-terminal winged helix domain-containing protein n=1 Tax=marine sediment metagenome TaxID=412755 RepID=X0RTC0_9ZZZZ
MRKEKAELGLMFLKCYLGGILELRTVALNLVVTADQKPRASAVARAQAELGRPYFTNMAHEIGRLSDICRYLLPHLTGQLDREGVRKALEKLVRDGTLVITGDGDANRQASPSQQVLRDAVDRTLRQLEAGGFMVG